MKDKKILVVDDEEAIRDVFTLALENEGYTVITADSGEAALKTLEKEKIHVMFLDLNLPEMNGTDLCRIIKKDSPVAICNAVTGYASVYDLVDCRIAGFDDYFTKPIKMKTLVDAANNAFEKIYRWTRK